MDNKKRVISIALLVLIVISLVYLLSLKSDIKDMQAKNEQTKSDLDKINNDTIKKEALIEDKKADLISDTTGISPRTVEEDEKIAEKFFKPAFSWTSGKEYDKVRADYMEKLGKGNTFTETYLPEDIKVTFEGEEISRIDYRKLKLELDGMKVVPLVAEGNRIRYVAFVNYIPYKTKADLVNKDVLESSQGIIKFTIGGEGERTVSEVEAWNGFTNMK